LSLFLETMSFQRKTFNNLDFYEILAQFVAVGAVVLETGRRL